LLSTGDLPRPHWRSLAVFNGPTVLLLCLLLTAGRRRGGEGEGEGRKWEVRERFGSPKNFVVAPLVAKGPAKP